MSSGRKRLDEALTRVSERGFDYDRVPSEDEVASKHAELRQQLDAWENLSHRQRNYSEWLQSPRWRELRNARLKLDGYVCQGCGSTATTAHHIWYPVEEHWDRTPLWTLVSLCTECHRLAHRIYRKGSVPWGVHDDTE